MKTRKDPYCAKSCNTEHVNINIMCTAVSAMLPMRAISNIAPLCCDLRSRPVCNMSKMTAAVRRSQLKSLQMDAVSRSTKAEVRHGRKSHQETTSLNWQSYFHLSNLGMEHTTKLASIWYQLLCFSRSSTFCCDVSLEDFKNLQKTQITLRASPGKSRINLISW